MTQERLTYAVPGWLAGAFAAGSVAAFAVATTTDTAGRFLFVVLGLVAAVEALRAVLLRPTIRADAGGIEVVTGVRRERHPWTAVAAVGTLEPPADGARLRRRANAVEVDLRERLLVVPGYRLGAPVAEVASELTRLLTPRS
ncbi:MAG TPA: PH domain-containing protein [Frankiaceae bacterium]|nr:PH domain-containing protein [Frankiaceae bacterium]